MILNTLKFANAHIKGSKNHPNINGIVTFKENKHGVLLTAKINGLPESKSHCKGNFFGFHIHERSFLFRKFRR